MVSSSLKIHCYKELRKKNLNELLDLLSTYLELQDDIQNLIEIDPENEKMYLNEHLYYYELNIRKIKNELEVRSENQAQLQF